MCDVMILDSGIDRRFFNELTHSYEYDPDTHEVRETKHPQDLTGHGSACAHMIRRLATNVRLGSIKILDPNLTGDSKSLEAALELCLSLDVSILHMSFSFRSFHITSRLKELFQRISNQGKWVVASVENGSEMSYPAALPTVIGVNGTLMPESETIWVDQGKPIQVAADMTPVWTHQDFSVYSLFGGNSKAAAVVTGHLARLLLEQNQNQQIDPCCLLAQTAQRFSWLDEELQRSPNLEITQPVYGHTLPINVLNRIKDIVSCYCNTRTGDHHLLLSKNGLSQNQFPNFIRDIASVVGIPANDMQWTFRHFSSFSHFICHIERIYHHESKTYA
ncbi:hypothetical protein DNH61_21150 [Paenibacillus sambharensis]|uniref:Peptidase S8/S53 domain-containing protein n=1 Tax=Paenibacillus sambharensis TaxID=1803190 RepID=A0A2W1LG61_9BACL|nr:S8 family serine peptidase [Paenibacillus sambharensis]PZD93995.1 hypothetical protein DNH61_21150 [Paenibacillus sambharensis]